MLTDKMLPSENLLQSADDGGLRSRELSHAFSTRVAALRSSAPDVPADCKVTNTEACRVRVDVRRLGKGDRRRQLRCTRPSAMGAPP